MKNKYLFLIVIVVLAWWLMRSRSEKIATPEAPSAAVKNLKPSASPTPTMHTDKKIAVSSSTLQENTETPKIIPKAPSMAVKVSSPDNEDKGLPFRVDADGLATLDGDIVLGEVIDGKVTSGRTETPKLKLWPGGRVPFHIQGDMEDPERIIKAMAMFADTGIQLVPEQGEEDILVFQNAPAECKSYLGRVGGKQPVFIGAQCGPTEIAHEIMHALGFIHEQNRLDRDGYVKIYWDNILDSAKINFEAFPESLMRASGQSPFDYQSLMIYHPSAFSKNGQDTLESVRRDERIIPAQTLSPGDRLRLQRTYGR